MHVVKKLSRSEYLKLRRKVRGNIFINSRQCLMKRLDMDSLDILAGGILCEKKPLIEIVSRNNGRVEIIEIAYLEKGEKLENASGFELTLYDFSGKFQVQVMGREWNINLHEMKEGDLVYVIGQIMPMNSPEKYFIIPSRIWSEEEFKIYQAVYADKLNDMKKRIDEIKRIQPAEMSVSDIMYYNSDWNPMEVLRQFLRKDERIDPLDYYWLCRVLYEFYLRKPSTKTASLIKKYYRKHMDACNLSGVEKYFGRSKEAFIEESFKSEYPVIYAQTDGF